MNEFAIASRTKSFLNAPAVVGFEAPFFDVLESIVSEFGHRVETRPGLLAVPGGPMTVSVHVDRHGFVTLDGGRVQYASSVAAHRPMGPRQAAIVCRRFGREEVVAYDPQSGETLGTGMIDHAAHCGIGGVDIVVPELRGIDPGIPVGFQAKDHVIAETISGQLDNALSVAIAIELIRDGFDGTVLFTAGEEAGLSWRALADWFDRPTDRLVVLDTSPFDDSGPVDRGAVVLRASDAGATFSSKTTKQMETAASSVSAEVVWKDEFLLASGRPLGRTELGRVIEATGGAVTGTTLQVPTTDYHTNHETTSLAAIAAVARTLAVFVA